MFAGTALGILETRGMAALMSATDAMLKAADVKLCGRHGIGSGWVTALITGTVAAVEAGIRAGEGSLPGHGELIRARVISRPDRSKLECLPHWAEVWEIEGPPRALGVLETRGLTPLIVGADAMAKAAAVELMGWAFVGGALCHGCISGDVAAVQTAILAGSDAAASVGEVFDELVLGQPDPGLGILLPPPIEPDGSTAPALGIVETTGYVATVAGADAMVKAADVRINRFSIGSGGRSLALARGPLDAVAAAVRAVSDVVPGVGQLDVAHVLSRPDSQTLACFAATAENAPERQTHGAMGLLETRSTVGLVKAMDAMLKAAPVEYEGSFKVGYFLTASVIRGSVGAVRTALDVGRQEAARYGELVAVHLIPRPYGELEQRLTHG